MSVKSTKPTTSSKQVGGATKSAKVLKFSCQSASGHELEFEFDLSGQTAHRNRELCPMQRMPWEVLRYLIEQRGKPVAYKDIWREVASSMKCDGNPVKPHIVAIREALGRDPDLIANRNGGYQFGVDKEGAKIVREVKVAESSTAQSQQPARVESKEPDPRAGARGSAPPSREAPRAMSLAPSAKYTETYRHALHFIRSQCEAHALGLKQLADATSSQISSAFSEHDFTGAVSVRVAEVDDFRRAFKLEYDQLYDRAVALGRPKAAADDTLPLLQSPFRSVADLICIDLACENQTEVARACKLAQQAIGGKPHPADPTRILLEARPQWELGKGKLRIEVRQVRLRADACPTPPRTGPTQKISVDAACELMSKFLNDPCYKRELLNRPVSESALFEYACCAFAGTSADRRDVPNIYEPSNDYEVTELYAIDLWVSHALHSLQCAGLRQLGDVVKEVEHGWPGVRWFKRMPPTRPLFWPGHVTGDLIKSLIFANAAFRDAHPVLPETRDAAVAWNALGDGD